MILSHPMKKVLPPSLKLTLKLWHQGLRDLQAGNFRKFPRNSRLSAAEISRFPTRITLSQSIKNTRYSENKKHNLATAIACIENRPIYPGELFSFWHWVGKPNRHNGYREGRAIVNDQLQSTIGGGLCQLSGLIYFLILKAGITPQERHPHSQDIYTEETRFAPLGSDATVVYGYKDLRFPNTLSTPICFRFNLLETEIVASLCSVKEIEEMEVKFKVSPEDKGIKKVETLRLSSSENRFELVASTLYPTRNG
ncbi:VanW family protein [Phormidium sp. CCY1219]|uniref:VanW family protein n=1 Tax=Phormidium sp. CCY1219 TaxID=2886104 RepID=UPI002D1E5907|nr:VanW family protein [Phormidium sp. CCY1219]MEB3829185.1 VanW family protein [Phormidium sp. CCY1219]